MLVWLSLRRGFDLEKEFRESFPEEAVRELRSYQLVKLIH
jgi:hypothetical protein